MNGLTLGRLVVFPIRGTVCWREENFSELVCVVDDARSDNNNKTSSNCFGTSGERERVEVAFFSRRGLM